MDTIQLIKYSMVSKMMSETSSKVFENQYYCIGALILFLLYQIIPIVLPDNITEFVITRSKEYIESICPKYDRDDSCIRIPSHKKIYYAANSHVAKESIKMDYSLRFRALNYFLQEKFNDISNFVEIVKIDNDKWGYETAADYILFPLNNSKVKIDDVRNIWIEVEIIALTKNEDSAESNKTATHSVNYSKNSEKQYIFKLTTPGKRKSKILLEFLDTIVSVYNTNVVNKKDKIIIEYIHSQKDDDDKVKMIYREYPFESNKFLDKNIFFDENEQLTKYVDQFSRFCPNNASYQEYATSGLTHKASILIYGLPGTGKSCTIRGILNRTGRIGVLVQWSKIKTCSEFVSLLRNLQINKKTYTLGELCFIFEDFGANGSKVLKKRKSTNSIDSTCNIINDFMIMPELETDSRIDEDIEKIENRELKHSIKKQIQAYKNKLKTAQMCNSSKQLDDELTLDCVLNTIDGIVELHDGMVIFTDNHIEDLDEAFLRPGRINYKLELKNASVKTIRAMVKTKFGLTEDEMLTNNDRFDCMKDCIISPADVQNICFKYTNREIGICLDEIVSRTNL